jgi:NAD-dependent DNA ligase
MKKDSTMAKKAVKKFDEKEFFRELSDKCDWEGGIVGMGWFDDELKTHFPKQLEMFKEWQELEAKLQDWIEENTPEEGQEDDEGEEMLPEYDFSKAQRGKCDQLAGKTLVVTGTLSNFSRKDIENLIKEHGGKVGSGVSKKTDYLVVGENPGSKLDKAQVLGVMIVDEEGFLKLIDRA